MRLTKKAVGFLSFAATCLAHHAESPMETELAVAAGTPWIVARRPPAEVSLRSGTAPGVPAMLSHGWEAPIP